MMAIGVEGVNIENNNIQLVSLPSPSLIYNIQCTDILYKAHKIKIAKLKINDIKALLKIGFFCKCLIN